MLSTLDDRRKRRSSVYTAAMRREAEVIRICELNNSLIAVNAAGMRKPRNAHNSKFGGLELSWVKGATIN